MPNLLTKEQQEQLDYPGDLTLEALAVLDAYQKSCCNISTTSKKLKKQYAKVRQLLKSPYVRELFKLKLLEKGITPERIADGIKAGLDATNGVYYEGNKVEDEPNWGARQKFNQLACEIYEVLKYNNKIDMNQVNIGPETIVLVDRREAINSNIMEGIERQEDTTKE